MIPLTRPVLGEAELVAVKRVLASGWVTQGPEVAAFEAEFADYCAIETGCAIAVSSCTAALHLVLYALGIGPGDEVITVSHSFIATANAVRYTGARPVFVDVCLDDFNIDPARVEAAITSRTKAILCVHQIGMPCQLAELKLIAERHGLKLVEDAACALGSSIENEDGSQRKIGNPVADAACFSFHPRKMITTGDGGMITTRDPEMAARLRRLRQHGMSANDLERHRASTIVLESYDELGFNYRMTDIQAAIGREQLKRLDGLVARRRKLADHYRALIATLPGVSAPEERSGVMTNWQSYCVLLPKSASQIKLMQHMQDNKIAVRRGIMCAHREPAYKDYEQRHDLSQSELAQDRGLVLPLFDALDEADLPVVVDTLKSGLERP